MAVAVASAASMRDNSLCVLLPLSWMPHLQLPTTWLSGHSFTRGRSLMFSLGVADVGPREKVLERHLQLRRHVVPSRV